MGIKTFEAFTHGKLNEATTYKPLKDKEAAKYVGKTIKEFFISSDGDSEDLKIKFEDGTEMVISASANEPHSSASITIY